ncbi:uncharacterized protein LOC113852014 [Abrus precatorius]|uniref:Uncharacterized protein LOC113852014 n=1 Tax=Abrus precatorius TaxID=3816 RepID=A0A8B8K339_ABRPR|nr:uncharacterized protein LOC113852014 [Abrus precatorius]
MIWVLLCMAVLLANAASVGCMRSRELDSMLDNLRVRGYDLFCNAIMTSDLQIELLSDQSQREANINTSHSFTFFAPTDASLFALDMTQTASSYTDTLRHHVVPRRLSLAQLRLLPEGYMLPTLLSQRHLQLTRSSPSAAITIAGVDVAFPGLYYGRDIAVHGLAGILSLRSNISPPPTQVVPPIRSADPQFFSPRSSPDSPENQPVLGPVSGLEVVSLNVTDRPGSPPPAEAPAPGTNAVTRQSQAASPVNVMVDTPDTPEREPDWTVLPPANLGDSWEASPPTYPDSAISLPPVEYSDATGPAPEALDGIRKCVNPDEGFEESIAGEQVSHMQCYAA